MAKSNITPHQIVEFMEELIQERGLDSHLDVDLVLYTRLACSSLNGDGYPPSCLDELQHRHPGLIVKVNGV